MKQAANATVKVYGVFLMKDFWRLSVYVFREVMYYIFAFLSLYPSSAV